MIDAYNSFIGMFNVLISQACIQYDCSEKDAIDKYIMPQLIEEIRKRNVLVMSQDDLDILKKSINSIKTSKKEMNLLLNLLKTIEELMHGND